MKERRPVRLRGGPHYHAATLKLAVVHDGDNYVVMDKSGLELKRGKPAVVRQWLQDQLMIHWPKGRKHRG